MADQKSLNYSPDRAESVAKAVVGDAPAAGLAAPAIVGVAPAAGVRFAPSVVGDAPTTVGVSPLVTWVELPWVIRVRSPGLVCLLWSLGGRSIDLGSGGRFWSLWSLWNLKVTQAFWGLEVRKLVQLIENVGSWSLDGLETADIDLEVKLVNLVNGAVPALELPRSAADGVERALASLVGLDRNCLFATDAGITPWVSVLLVLGVNGDLTAEGVRVPVPSVASRGVLRDDDLCSFADLQVESFAQKLLSDGRRSSQIEDLLADGWDSSSSDCRGGAPQGIRRLFSHVLELSRLLLPAIVRWSGFLPAIVRWSWFLPSVVSWGGRWASVGVEASISTVAVVACRSGV